MSGFGSIPPALARQFESAKTALTAGGLVTFLHGLGSEPSLVRCLLVCKTAGGGFAVGDRIDLTASEQRESSSYIACGLSVCLTATRILIRVGSDRILTFLPDKRTGSAASLLVRRFDLIVRAWA